MRRSNPSVKIKHVYFRNDIFTNEGGEVERGRERGVAAGITTITMTP